MVINYLNRGKDIYNCKLFKETPQLASLQVTSVCTAGFKGLKTSPEVPFSNLFQNGMM